ncbi:AAA family ATPase [Paraferrimonas sedimenticola]|uniref:ATPase AAA n=1 Tax=Paraferrimonas sedimenticola TaxID=375674 RepID=A0AA37W1N1_9GAMM|nr:MoxR family ATPase [Paraferrimonas sedimenticola]GLP96477.1 ATPase AAA [Paraferrimonas sedimenticola]
MHQLVDEALRQLNRVILDKPREIQLALACVLARGHLLLNDLPGVGKSTLAQALADTLGLSHQRVQFTSDMLPADLVGVSIFDQQTQQFVFHPGPVFNQVVLADEINRASPKTQSALLEAMAENQVSMDGNTYGLPTPFFVIASQNPMDQAGTFPLPESQLDRFMVRLSLGYPNPQAELTMLAQSDSGANTRSQQAMDVQQLVELQALVDRIQVSEPVLRYIVALANASRNNQSCYPLSPRASKALLACTKAWAFIQQREFATADDVQAVFEAVAQHRLTGLQPQTQANSAINLLSKVDPLQ